MEGGLASSVGGAAIYGGLLLLPLYLHLLADLTVTTTGLLLVMGLGSAAALYPAGAATDRHGPGPITLTGTALLSASTAALLLPGVPPIPVLATILLLRGAAIAWAQMPAVTAAYTTARPEQVGDAAAPVNITQRVGGALAAAILVSTLTHTGGPTSTHAYTWAFTILTALSLAALAALATPTTLHRHTRTTAARTRIDPLSPRATTPRPPDLHTATSRRSR